MSDLPAKYYEECLMKKEGKGKWKDYWVVIRGSWMLFYANKNITDRNNFRGSLELSKDSKCSVSKRRGYSFPFYISTLKGTHLFKCQSNLQRHQWIYVIGLAIKRFPPLAPPNFVPKASIKDGDGDFVSSWETSRSPEKTSEELSEDSLSYSNDDDDGDDDDDNLSLPPGVIIVSNLPDDLTKVEGDREDTREKEMILNSLNKEMNEDQKEDHTIPLNAVLSTGITGSTKVVLGKSNNNKTRSNKIHFAKPVFARQVSKSTGSIKDEQFKNYSMKSQSSQLYNRPSTSPLLSTFHRAPLTCSPSNSTKNLKFSRHMTNSAPDVKTLSMEND